MATTPGLKMVLRKHKNTHFDFILRFAASRTEFYSMETEHRKSHVVQVLLIVLVFPQTLVQALGRSCTFLKQKHDHTKLIYSYLKFIKYLNKGWNY